MSQLSDFFDVFHDLVRSGRANVRSGFGGWVPEVYDLMEGDFQDDIPLVVDLASETGGPVVDLGSGTGRLSIPLAETGTDVFALDSDSSMQERLKQKLSRMDEEIQGRITHITEDIRTFKLPEPARLAICSTNTFLYLGSLEQQRIALENIRENLTEDGLLWLDVFVPKPNPSAQEPYLTSVFDPDSNMLLLYCAQARDDHFDGFSLVNAFTMVFGRKPEPEIYVQSWRYAWLHPNELRLLLEVSGFEVEETLGDYDGGSADDISTQMIAIARKMESIK